MLSMQRMTAIARKEVAHISRDPFTIALALVLPMMIVLIFGFAFEFNLNNISLAVHDGDRSAASRTLIESFSSSGHFKVQSMSGPQAVTQALDQGRARAGLVIDPGFERKALSQQEASVQILVDGADNTSAGSILSYLPQVQRLAQERITGLHFEAPITLKTRYLFNHELKTSWFIVPGLGVVVLAILSILLTSLTVAREWENSSMELLLSTPLKPIEIVIGKLAPYLVLGLGSVVFIYLTARLVFGVPFLGSHLLYLLGCFLFVTTCMAQGLFISVVTRAQQISMQAAIVSGLLPSLFLSGFIYPIEHMPRFFHYFTGVLAPRWFMQISREIYLKGSTLSELGLPFLALSIICLGLIGLATINFKKDVEP
jgi:ABC-2 type transport system permease protein